MTAFLVRILEGIDAVENSEIGDVIGMVALLAIFLTVIWVGGALGFPEVVQ